MGRVETSSRKIVPMSAYSNLPIFLWCDPVKGSFTGAHQRKIGKFEYADMGTIFLDEVSTLPMHLQIKLLRVLQERAFERVGSNSQIKVDIRVVAATNAGLEEEGGKGRFREDVSYSLKGMPT